MLVLWGITGLVLMAVSGCGKKPPPLRTLETNATVLAFGDSLTFGTGAETGQSYPAQLARLIKRDVVNHGVPGEISRDGLARLPAVLDEVQPRLMILCHGGNDFLRKLGEDSAAANVRAMIKLARDRNISVVLLATPKPGLLLSAPEFYANIAREFDIPVDTKTLAEVLGDRSLKADLVHPNAQGYAGVAKSLAALLKKSGAID